MIAIMILIRLTWYLFCSVRTHYTVQVQKCDQWYPYAMLYSSSMYVRVCHAAAFNLSFAITTD